MAFGNVGAAQQAQQQERDRFDDSDDVFFKTLRLAPGEAVVVRFKAGDDQPEVYYAHTLSKSPQTGWFGKITCSQKIGPCLGHIASNQQRSVYKPDGTTETKREDRCKRESPRAAFFLYSMRGMAKINKPKRDGSGYFESWDFIRFNVLGQPLFENPKGGWYVYEGEHPYLNGQYETKQEGLKIWDSSLTEKANNGTALLRKDYELQQLCQCGAVSGQGAGAGPARILIKGYSCGSCGQEIAYDPKMGPQATCAFCRQTSAPKESVQCTAGCGNPRRGSLTDCYVKIMRNGEGTDTTYEFAPLPFGAADPAVAVTFGACDWDLEELFGPTPLIQQQQMLFERGVQVQMPVDGLAQQQQMPQMPQSPFLPQGGQPQPPQAVRTQPQVPQGPPMPFIGGHPVAARPPQQFPAAMVPPVPQAPRPAPQPVPTPPLRHALAPPPPPFQQPTAARPAPALPPGVMPPGGVRSPDDEIPF